MQLFERWLAVMLKPWFMLSFLGLVALSYGYIDRPLAIYLHGLDLKIKLPFLYWITCLGETQIYVVLLLVLALTYRWVIHQKTVEMRIWFLWFCVLFSGGIGLVLKLVLGRARPDLLFDQHIFGFYGWHMQKAFFSFPSGHVTAITSLATGLTVLFPRYCYAFVIAALCMMLTRVLLTYHYVSDVLASAYLVFLELGLLCYILRRRYPKTWGLLLK